MTAWLLPVVLHTSCSWSKICEIKADILITTELKANWSIDQWNLSNNRHYTSHGEILERLLDKPSQKYSCIGVFRVKGKVSFSHCVCKIRSDKQRLHAMQVFNANFTILPLANGKGRDNFSILGRNFVSEDKTAPDWETCTRNAKENGASFWDIRGTLTDSKRSV